MSADEVPLHGDIEGCQCLGLSGSPSLTSLFLEGQVTTPKKAKSSERKGSRQASDDMHSLPKSFYKEPIFPLNLSFGITAQQPQTGDSLPPKSGHVKNQPLSRQLGTEALVISRTVAGKESSIQGNHDGVEPGDHAVPTETGPFTVVAKDMRLDSGELLSFKGRRGRPTQLSSPQFSSGLAAETGNDLSRGLRIRTDEQMRENHPFVLHESVVEGEDEQLSKREDLGGKVASHCNFGIRHDDGQETVHNDPYSQRVENDNMILLNAHSSQEAARTRTHPDNFSEELSHFARLSSTARSPALIPVRKVSAQDDAPASILQKTESQMCGTKSMNEWNSSSFFSPNHPACDATASERNPEEPYPLQFEAAARERLDLSYPYLTEKYTQVESDLPKHRGNFSVPQDEDWPTDSTPNGTEREIFAFAGNEVRQPMHTDSSLREGERAQKSSAMLRNRRNNTWWNETAPTHPTAMGKTPQSAAEFPHGPEVNRECRNPSQNAIVRPQKRKRTRAEDLDPTQVHVCSFHDCHKKFAKKYNLKIHERRHRGDLPFICQLCQKKFMWQSSYSRHLKVHESRQESMAKASRKKTKSPSNDGPLSIQRVTSTTSTMRLNGMELTIDHLKSSSVALAASLCVLNSVAYGDLLGTNSSKNNSETANKTGDTVAMEGFNLRNDFIRQAASLTNTRRFETDQNGPDPHEGGGAIAEIDMIEQFLVGEEDVPGPLPPL